MRVAIIAVMALGPVLFAAPAEACSPARSGQYGLQAHLPEDGAEQVAVDAPLLFTVDCRPPGDQQVYGCGSGRVEVTITPAEGGLAMTGTAQPFGDQYSLALEQALEPETRYVVAAGFGEGTAVFEGARQSAQFSFTTGTHTLESIKGGLETPRAEAYDAPTAECSSGDYVGATAHRALNPVGCSIMAYGRCEHAGTVTLPRVGLDFRAPPGSAEGLGYRVELQVSAPTPAPLSVQLAPRPPPQGSNTVLLKDWRYVAEGERATLYLDLPRPEAVDGEDGVCVQAAAMDAAGRLMEQKPLCKSYQEWLMDAELVERETEDGTPELLSLAEAQESEHGGDLVPEADTPEANTPEANTPEANTPEPEPLKPKQAPGLNAVDEADAPQSGSCSLPARPDAVSPLWLVALSCVALRRRRLSRINPCSRPLTGKSTSN